MPATTKLRALGWEGACIIALPPPTCVPMLPSSSLADLSPVQAPTDTNGIAVLPGLGRHSQASFPAPPDHTAHHLDLAARCRCPPYASPHTIASSAGL
ncbi:hypothetical protein E2562_021307 [Oryza meyeriana var. granulata]|uniref:Uncharacterized protein n=1 Tax=Oryza meyeriana var. granulata TaxID=110450 RepID=A0A6G1BZH1_9ORYZ|nr:hypothetical protein E2562_021307 [Oryza meyeriana var. granulata]